MKRTAGTRWTALAMATAIVAAPVAWSGDRIQASFQPRAGMTPAAMKAAAQERHDRFIITYRSGAQRLSAAATTRALADAAREAGVGIRPMRQLATGASLVRTDRKLDRAAAKQLAVALLKQPGVLAVEPDRRYQPAFVPNDPLYPLQWHYRDGPGGINVEPAWDISTGEGIVVAVLDTGITPHSDLDANILPGYDFIFDPDVAVDGDGRDPDPNDPGDWHDGECNIFDIPEDSSWHGTHVAGTVAAVTDNGLGVAGVAHGGDVVPVRVLGRCGGYTSDIIDAVTWASGGSVPDVPANPNPAEVINLSLGGAGACLLAEQQAFDDAIARGTTVVIAAGNAGGNAGDYSPGNCENVINVAAVGPTGSVASYSNYGEDVDVAAPGGTATQPAEDNILSTWNLGTQGQGTEGYAWMAGTSMAAPHVAGVVALMQSAAADAGDMLTPVEVEEILVNTAYASGGFPGNCNYNRPCGSGIVDAEAAVRVAAGLDPLPDAPPPPPPPPPAIELQNGQTVTGIEVEAGGEVRYQIEVPNGSRSLAVVMSGGTGDADLYVRHEGEPSDAAFDCRPYLFGNNETCFFPNPEGGTWYITIRGFTAASGVSLYVSFIDSGWPYALEAEARARGRNHVSVDLTWDGGDAFVDLYRDGELVRTMRNRGQWTDNVRVSGDGSLTYMVCNRGTDECSDPETVDYDN